MYITILAILLKSTSSLILFVLSLILEVSRDDLLPDRDDDEVKPENVEALENNEGAIHRAKTRNGWFDLRRIGVRFGGLVLKCRSEKKDGNNIIVYVRHLHSLVITTWDDGKRKEEEPGGDENKHKEEEEGVGQHLVFEIFKSFCPIQPDVSEIV